MVFERADGTFSGVAVMHAGRDQLKVIVVVAEEGLECSGTLIVKVLEARSEAGGDEPRVNRLERREYALVGATAHRFTRILLLS